MNDDTIDAHDRRIGENAKDLAYLKQEVRELRETIDRIERVVDTGSGAATYEAMTRKDKVRKVRAYLVEQAQSGRAYLTYDNVVAVFDGRPSPGHAYDLMRLAGEAQGFDYQEREDGRPNRIVVEIDEISEDAAFHAVNKAEESLTA